MINHKYLKSRFKQIQSILSEIKDEISQIDNNNLMVKEDLNRLLLLLYDNCYHFVTYIIQLEKVEEGKQDDLS